MPCIILTSTPAPWAAEMNVAQPRGAGEQSSPGTAQRGRSTRIEPGRMQAGAGEPAPNPLPQQDGAPAAPTPRGAPFGSLLPCESCLHSP